MAEKEHIEIIVNQMLSLLKLNQKREKLFHDLIFILCRDFRLMQYFTKNRLHYFNRPQERHSIKIDGHYYYLDWNKLLRDKGGDNAKQT